MLVKYSSKILSSLEFARYNFFGDSFLGIIVLVLGVVDVITAFNMSLSVVAINGCAGFLCLIAELCLIKAIEDGYTGPVVAIISFNSILSSSMAWLINGLALNSIQIIGILIGFAGVTLLSLKSETAKSDEDENKLIQKIIL